MFLEERRALSVDHCAAPASKFVEFVNKRMSYMHTTSIHLFQISFSCMCLHSYGSKDGKGACKTLSEKCQCRTLQEIQKAFLDSCPAQPDSPVIGNAADPIPRDTERRTRFPRDSIEREDSILHQSWSHIHLERNRY